MNIKYFPSEVLAPRNSMRLTTTPDPFLPMLD